MPKKALEEIGPCLTSKLSSYLRDRDGISAESARKRIQRSLETGAVQALQTVNFAHNQKFVYLRVHTGTRQFYDRLFEAMNEANSILRLPLAAMRARGGAIPEKMFATISGLPIKSDFKQDSNGLKKTLTDLGFIEKEGEYLHLSKNSQKFRLSSTQLEAIIQAENSLLKALADWLQRQRLIGNQMTFRFNDEIPQTGHFQWDFVAPSYIAPLATRMQGKATPGFIVADVILGRSITKHEVQYFVEKCASIRVHRNNRPFMAFLIADWFEEDALRLAQSNGVIFTTPKMLFGRNFAEALEEFRKILEEQTLVIEEQAVRISELLKKTSELAFADKLNENLRGQLFELVVGHCHSKIFPGTVQLGKKFKDPMVDKKWDCDVLQTAQGTSLRACECKAYRRENQVSIDEVKKWFVKIVPAIRDYFPKDDYPEQEFSIWTCGNFDDDALEWIEAFASQNRKFKVSYKKAEDLDALVNKVGDPTIKDAYIRWFTLISPKKESAA